MIISFDVSLSSIDKEQRLYWTGVLWKLVDEYIALDNTTQIEFDPWLYETWKVEILRHPEKPEIITGVFIDESTVSMLLLKYKIENFR